MSLVQPFTPNYGSGVTISATTSSANANFTSNEARQMYITNAGTDSVFIQIGAGTQTASTNDMPLLSGRSIIVSLNPADNNIAAICPSTTATVYAIPGNGK